MNTVAIFLKYPAPGKVKTRLAKQLGNERAAAIYSAMAKKVLTSAQMTGWTARVFFDPPDMERETREWLRDFQGEFSPQSGISLGEKMSNAIGECLGSGSKKVAVIGTDCPDVTPEILKDAFERLDGADVVIGPCEDGGYYLIGMTRLHGELFRGIEWSTNTVTARTVEKAEKLSLKVSMLQTLRDIDEAKDLNLTEAKINGEKSAGPLAGTVDTAEKTGDANPPSIKSTKSTVSTRANPGDRFAPAPGHRKTEAQ